jgi:hypothetical protein
VKTRSGTLQSVFSLRLERGEMALTKSYLKKGINMQSKYSKLLLVFVGALVLFAGAPVDAHHAFAAEYDGHQRVTITGTLTGFDWFNPHAWLHVDVKDADGKVENWLVEFGDYGFQPCRSRRNRGRSAHEERVQGSWYDRCPDIRTRGRQANQDRAAASNDCEWREKGELRTHE